MKTAAEILQLVEQNRTEELIHSIEAGDCPVDKPIPYPDSEACFTLLEYAAGRGEARLVDVLIRLGADVNVRQRGGPSALMAASAAGHDRVVDRLVLAGAKLDTKCDGMTALMEAAEQKHVGTVIRLLEAGASVTQKDRKGMTALSYYVRTGKAGQSLLTRLFDAGSLVDGRDLHMPTAKRDVEILKLLLSRCSDVNAEYDWTTTMSDIQKGDTPLLVAVARTVEETLKPGATGSDNRLAVVDMLIQAGAVVEVQRKSDGLTPLLLAVIQDDLEVAERLIAAGADPEREYECRLRKFPFSQPKTRYPKSVSAVSMAEMRPRSRRVRELLLSV